MSRHDFGAWSAIHRGIAARGTRVEVTVDGGKQLAEAAENWIRAGNADGCGAARAAALDVAVCGADGLLEMIRSGRLPRRVTYDKGGKEYAYNPMGREASYKQARRPWGIFVGPKGARSQISSDMATRVEVLLDPDAEVYVLTADGGEERLSTLPLHQDVATAEEREKAAASAQAKRERISGWLEKKQRAERGEPEPVPEPDAPSAPVEPPEVHAEPDLPVEPTEPVQRAAGPVPAAIRAVPSALPTSDPGFTRSLLAQMGMLVERVAAPVRLPAPLRIVEVPDEEEGAPAAGNPWVAVLPTKQVKRLRTLASALDVLAAQSAEVSTLLREVLGDDAAVPF